MNNYYRMDGWVKTTLGPAVPGAQVYVCLQPANVFPPITPPKTLPVPWAGPNPQAPIFSDAGLTPIIQPILTDGFGHYDFYVTPGLYTIVVLFGGKVQQFYVDQSLGNAGSISISPLVLSTNGTPNFNQTALNFIQGSGITLSTDNFGNMTITGNSSITLQTNEVPNVSQSLLDLHAGTGVSLVDNGSGRVTVANTSPASGIPNQFGFANWCAARHGASSTNTMINFGLQSTWTAANSATFSIISPTATEPYMGNYTTPGTAQTLPYGALSQTADGAIGVLRRVGFRVQINQDATDGHVRYWIAEANSAGGPNALYSDTPNISIFGFRFSPTSASDTKWMCYAGVGSGAGQFTATSSGVTPDKTASHYFEIQNDGSNGLNYYIDNALVGHITVGVTVPATTTLMKAYVLVDNQNNASARSFQFASWYLENVK